MVFLFSSNPYLGSVPRSKLRSGIALASFMDTPQQAAGWFINMRRQRLYSNTDTLDFHGLSLWKPLSGRLLVEMIHLTVKHEVWVAEHFYS